MNSWQILNFLVCAGLPNEVVDIYISITFQLFPVPVTGLLDSQSVSFDVSVLTLTNVLETREFEGINEACVVTLSGVLLMFPAVCFASDYIIAIYYRSGSTEFESAPVHKHGMQFQANLNVKSETRIFNWILKITASVLPQRKALDPEIILVVNSEFRVSDNNGNGEFGKESIYLSWLKYYKLLQVFEVIIRSHCPVSFFF